MDGRIDGEGGELVYPESNRIDGLKIVDPFEASVGAVMMFG